MSTCSKDPEETYPLRGYEEHRGNVSQKNGDDKGIAMPPLLSTRPASPGFIYPPILQPSADGNPYETPPAFNPAFKPVTNGTADPPDEDTDQMRKSLSDDVENATPTSASQDDGCCECCGMTILVIIIIVIIAVIVYFAIKHPNLVTALHSDINENENARAEGEPAGKSIMSVLTNELTKLVNHTNTTPAPRPPPQDDGTWFIDDGFVPHLT